ncbi:MAG: VWA domain-containing protein, partial [Chthoniobacteraceae bacterium]|nr:VWA domain-containing protein [Chthoniobacteraceae bacterium]
MFSRWNKHWRGAAPFLAACALLLPTLLPSSARAELDPAVTRSAEDPGASALVFQYRLFPAAEVETLRVTQNGKALEARHTPFASNPRNTGAILVLVDTSRGSTRAPRARTLEENKRLIQSLLAQAGPSLSIGVCAFANDLVEVAPLGSPFGDIQSRVGDLKADGLGARLYRQGMHAVEKLAAAPAARKALLILSDGKDEDNGFIREDLLRTSLQARVAIFAMGCPETGADIPFLRNLEKLAAETRGLYAQARIGIPGPGERLKTDAAFVRDMLASLQSGGEVRVPLNALAGGDVLFELTTKAGETFRYVHAHGGKAAPTPIPAAVPAATPAATPPA